MATSKKSNGKKLRVQTSSVAATLVNLLVKQASGEVKKIRATCGRGFEKPLANYNPDTQSWKMLEDISLWGDSPSLVNLPPSGTTRSGVLYLRPAWEPIIGETASSSWPTPTAVTRPMEGNVRLYRVKIEAGEMTEAEAEAILGKSVWMAQGKVKEMWPTPTARDWKGAAGFKDQNRNLADLTFRAQILDGHRTWPTPTHGKLAGGSGAFQKIADLCSDGKISDEERKAMQAGNGGSLNPMWVEWLMGFPPGWTDLKDSETL
jgi:hypothetical protein